MFKIFEIEIRIYLICLRIITSVCVHNLHLFKRYLLVDFHSFSLKSQGDMVIFLNRPKSSPNSCQSQTMPKISKHQTYFKSPKCLHQAVLTLKIPTMNHVLNLPI